MTPLPFTLDIAVTDRDIDEQGHVNNVVYLRYVQDVATAHWNTLAHETLKKQCAWVVLRHEIDYVNPAVAGDILEARTWVGETTGVRSVRLVDLYLKGTQRVVARARTVWCLLNAQSRKPMRIDPVIISLLQPQSRA